MACTNPQNPDCKNCNKAGLAILPVRYAVVPNDVMAFLPATMGNKVTDVQLSHHRYTLRTLRQGFVYVFYEKSARGLRNFWEIYSVTSAGTLWKQLSIMAVQPILDEPSCSGSGHNIPASVITIEKPEKCGTVWIAFSEHIWSPETLRDFAKNVKLRDRRMQTIIPAQWVKNRTYRHGVEATQEQIEAMIEYQDNFNTYSLEPGALPIISKEDGSHIAANLKKCSTRYPLHMRKGQSKLLADKMKQIGEHPHGHYPGMVMALWDAVGITHEINGFRNDAAGWIEKYGTERDLQLTAMNAIEGGKKALEDKAVNDEKWRQEHVRQSRLRGSPSTARREQAVSLPEPQRSQNIEIYDILDDWERRELPNLGYSARLYAANSYPEPKRSTEIAKIKADAERFLQERAKNGPEQIANAKDSAWSKYAAKLNQPEYESFIRNYDAFITAVDTLIDQRTDDLINWLESKWFINALTEFHQSTIEDGIVFDDQVGRAIHGMNSTIKGRQKIDNWVKEMKATESNLIWRTIALNQKEGMDAVDAAMAAAAANAAPVGKLAVDFVAKHVRKMADIYKKANTMQNTYIKAADAAERIKKIAVNDFDRFFMTVGDRLFKPFLQRGVDTAAEYAVRGLMLCRAGVEPDRILDAIKEQAKSEGLARNAIVRRLQAAKTFIGSGQDFKEAKFKELKATWEKLKENPTRGPTALKENRLSWIVATLEIVNLTKIAWELKDDRSKYGELAASACSTTAALMDIAANSAKHLVGDKVSVTFQKLKVFGGVLSAGAGYYSALQDWDKTTDNFNRNNYVISLGYLSKSTLQFGSAMLGLLASISYAAPLLESSASKATQWIGGRLLFYKLFCLTWAVRLNMVGLAVTAIIWVATPNPMKEWCEESPFGPKKDKGTKDPKKLLEKFGVALHEAS